MSQPSLSAFLRDRVVQHPSLACPVMVLWRGYSVYCEKWGFDRVSAEDFVRWLGCQEGVEIREGGHGRLRRVAMGVAPRQEERAA